MENFFQLARNSPFPHSRRNAIKELSTSSIFSSDPRVIYLLGEISSSDTNKWIRILALQQMSLLCAHISEEAFQQLFQKMATSSTSSQHHFPLFFSGSFIIALEDEYSSVRLECLFTIKTISSHLLKSNSSPSFIPNLFLLLVDLLEDEDLQVRIESLQIMREILISYRGSFPSSSIEIFFDSLSRLALFSALDVGILLLNSQKKSSPTFFIDFLINRAIPPLLSGSYPLKDLRNILLFLKCTSSFNNSKDLESFSSSPFFSLMEGVLNDEVRILYPFLNISFNQNDVLENNYFLISRIESFITKRNVIPLLLDDDDDEFYLLMEQLQYCIGPFYRLLEDILVYNECGDVVKEFPFSKYKGIPSSLIEWIRDPSITYKLCFISEIDIIKVKIISLKRRATLDDIYQLLIEGTHNGSDDSLGVWIDGSLIIEMCPCIFSFQPILKGKGNLMDIRTIDGGVSLLSLIIPSIDSSF